MGRVRRVPREAAGASPLYSRRMTAPAPTAPAPVTTPQSPSLPTPWDFGGGFEIRAGVTVLIEDAEGVS